MSSHTRRLLRGPDNSFLLTTKPFAKPTRHNTIGFELSLKSIEPPFSSKLDEELDFLCSSFGFSEPFGKQNSASLVFKELVKNARMHFPLKTASTLSMLSSSELSRRLRLSRGAIINQLNNLQRSGLVVKRGRLYGVRSNSILRTIEELEADVSKVFEKTKKVAKQIDEDFGMLG